MFVKSSGRTRQDRRWGAISSADQKLKREIKIRNSIKRRLAAGFAKTRLRLVLFLLVFIVAAEFIVAALLQNRGTFTITTPRGEMINYGFVLSETREFKYYSHELQFKPVADMWNTTQDWLPANLDEIDGEHNAPDGTYLAYTFYTKNSGDEAFNYIGGIDITDKHLNVDEAMRLRLYIDGTPTVYARRDSLGAAVEGTVPFNSRINILSLPSRIMPPGDIHKYTVVVWLEGSDPECVNDILGGFIKMIFSFRVIPLPSERHGV